MENKLVLLIAHKNEINPTAVQTVLRDYENRQFSDDVWIIRTPEDANAFMSKVRSSIGANAVVIPLEREALRNAALTPDLQTFVAQTRAA